MMRRAKNTPTTSLPFSPEENLCSPSRNIVLVAGSPLRETTERQLPLTFVRNRRWTRCPCSLTQVVLLQGSGCNSETLDTHRRWLWRSSTGGFRQRPRRIKYCIGRTRPGPTHTVLFRAVVDRRPLEDLRGMFCHSYILLHSEVLGLGGVRASEQRNLAAAAGCRRLIWRLISDWGPVRLRLRSREVLGRCWRGKQCDFVILAMFVMFGDTKKGLRNC